MDMVSDYQVPTALTVLAGIFLGLGAAFMLLVLADIFWRQGWKSIMLIMIPVYPINAAYLPIAFYIYWKYGRPTKPEKSRKLGSEKDLAKSSERPPEHDKDLEAGHDEQDPPNHSAEQHHHHDHHDMQDMNNHQTNSQQSAHAHQSAEVNHEAHHGHNMHDMHGPSPDRPMWVTVTIGVMHCGAGCVLGDLVGEWLVYGTGASINGHDIWSCLLIDYGFALLFGIAFQYFSIAPMSGEWGMKTVWRAAKADVLSLTFFEIGLFGWMIIYQVAIWEYKLPMDTWTYWWMMQAGMILGFVTAWPINWWLITRKIKEPCA